MSLLITPTLLDSYEFFKSCSQDWKNRAYIGLYNTLNRIFEDNEPAKIGREFETKVYANAHNPIVGSLLFQKVCNLVNGCSFQYKAKKIIEVDGIEYLLFGKLDAYKTGKIFDIKTTENYKGKDSYLSKWQHIFYTYIMRVNFFMYIVVEWYGGDDPEMKYKIEDVHCIEYNTENSGDNLEKIKSGIKEFISFLETEPELKEAYYNKFNLYK
jgi:hypothetical protein